MFVLNDKDINEPVVIYQVKDTGERIDFLIYNDEEFVWVDSSYFEPIS